MSKRKRILTIVGTLVVIGGIYLWFFGFQTVIALMARYEFLKLPDIAKRPVSLSDLSISNVPHKTVSYFGYDFELPWDDVDETKEKSFGTVHVTYFRSGNAFWFSTFPPKDFVNAVMKTDNLDPQGLKQLYGEDTLESDYAFHKKMLELTPSEINPFISRRQAISGQMLLIVKGVSMPNASSGIFSIETRCCKGFQFENPQTHPSRITVKLFSDVGGIYIRFLQKAGAPAVSQPEINRVIQSIHGTPLQAASVPVGQNGKK